MKKKIRATISVLVASALAVPAAAQVFGATIRADENSANAGTTVEINEKNFPDANLRKTVSEYDENKDKKLDEDELLYANTIEVPGKGIKTLKGVELLPYLYNLDCSGNELTELDLSQNKNLSYIDCACNQLTKLDVSTCDPVTLSCDSNFLKELDVSHMPSLRNLTCAVNDLAKLDVSKNTKLSWLYCGTIDYLHMDGGLGSEEEEIREINNHLTKLDLHAHTELERVVIDGNKITELDLSKSKKLEGVECSDNPLTSLKMSNSNVKYLNCNNTLLTTLDLTGCRNLEELECHNGKLQFLNVKDSEKLVLLSCQENQLTKLDLPKKGALVGFDACTNQLTELDISGMKDMEYCYVYENKITKLDTSKLSSLTSFNCDGNPVTELDFSSSKELDSVNCSDTKIKKLDFSNNPKLTWLFCYDTPLESLNVTKCPDLERMFIDGSKLTSVDLTKNTHLKEVSLSENQLAKIDLSHNTELTSIQFYGTALTELDVSKCTKLQDVRVMSNKLKSLKLPKTSGKLEGIYANDNQLQSFDVSGYPNLIELALNDNQLSSLDLSKNTKLEFLRIAGNKLTSLDISKCAPLVGRLKKYGVKENTESNYFFSEISVDDSSYVYFSVDTKVDRKGYKLPKPTNPDPTFEDFVERLYTVALNRASEPEGKQFWIKQVVEEGKTGADCARFFLLEADEFMNRNLSVEDFVETLYKTFFDRESDAAGKKGWVDAIQSGSKTRADVVNDFIESTEWCNVCATYGVKSGAMYHKATKASKNTINFATRLYTCCLKRDAEKGGLDYWSLALTNLEKTGAQAAQFFFEGEEFVGLKTTDREYLMRLYTTFMDREPSEEEIGFWTGEIKAGRQNRHSILAFFAQSPEFTAICKKYGIDRGEIA
ncbi:MAG: DUF4214 domain-containing protein [Clostridiales bacterium]|nr:DUF4214 domain-containing protein [Clostridiales bacterium]